MKRMAAGAARARLRALDEGEAAGLAGDDGDGALDLGQRLARAVLDQAADERRLAHAGRAVHEHHERRRLLRRALHHRHCRPAPPQPYGLLQLPCQLLCFRSAQQREDFE